MLIHALTAAFLVLGSASSATLEVGEDYGYRSIQAAVDSAEPGDTVLVHAGTYRENVKITKPIILRGLSRPVVDASSRGSAVTVLADGVTVDGLEETNLGLWPEAGIMVMARNVTISNNLVRRCLYGIGLLQSDNVTVTGNNASHNLVGICLLESSGGSIKDNIVCDNWFGASFYRCKGSSVTGNLASGNKFFGIVHLRSEDDLLSENRAEGNMIGIRIWSSANNTICRNTAVRNARAGIFLSGSADNILFENIFRDNSEFDAFDSGTDSWDNRTVASYATGRSAERMKAHGGNRADPSARDASQGVQEGSVDVKQWYQGRKEIIF